jgi:hypothetical protein
VLGLNWHANFVVSLLISVFSLHLFFNPSHHNLYRRHHFFPIPRAFSRTSHTGACDMLTYAVRSKRRTARPRCLAVRSGAQALSRFVPCV